MKPLGPLCWESAPFPRRHPAQARTVLSSCLVPFVGLVEPGSEGIQGASGHISVPAHALSMCYRPCLPCNLDYHLYSLEEVRYAHPGCIPICLSPQIRKYHWLAMPPILPLCWVASRCAAAAVGRGGPPQDLAPDPKSPAIALGASGWSISRDMAGCGPSRGGGGPDILLDLGECKLLS